MKISLLKLNFRKTKQSGNLLLKLQEVQTFAWKFIKHNNAHSAVRSHNNSTFCFILATNLSFQMWNESLLLIGCRTVFISASIFYYTDCVSLLRILFQVLLFCDTKCRKCTTYIAILYLGLLVLIGTLVEGARVPLWMRNLCWKM